MGHGDAPPPQGYPYPPAQSQGGVTAPGGYPVQSPAAAAAAAGSSAGHPYPPPQGAPYPPQPHPSAMEPPSKQPQMGGPPPPSGYPGAAPAMGGGPYPPAGGPAPYPPQAGHYPPGAGPSPGYPVMGTPAGGMAGGPQPMSMEQGGVGGVPPGQEPCGCTVGWVLFAIGFLFWPCWVAAAFVPLCTKSRSDRLAGIASTIGMLCLTVIAIIIGATSSRWRYY